jgi:hypothetical protein
MALWRLVRLVDVEVESPWPILKRDTSSWTLSVAALSVSVVSAEVRMLCATSDDKA